MKPQKNEKNTNKRDLINPPPETKIFVNNFKNYFWALSMILNNEKISKVEKPLN